MMKKRKSNHICIFKTGKILEHDIVANALTKSGVPFFKETENITGLRLAMSFQPAMGPGTYYNILVHESFSEKAQNILNELPGISADEIDIFHFGASEKQKRWWKRLIWFVLFALFALSWLSIVNNM